MKESAKCALAGITYRPSKRTLDHARQTQYHNHRIHLGKSKPYNLRRWQAAADREWRAKERAESARIAGIHTDLAAARDAQAAEKAAAARATAEAGAAEAAAAAAAAAIARVECAEQARRYLLHL